MELGSWRQKLGGVAGKIIRVVTLGWLVCHCVLTASYNLPANPAKATILPILNVTIGTFFQQNWSLFAPNPLADNITLLVRPLTDQEYQKYQHAKPTELPDTGWYDISVPLYKAFQRNRFSCYDRLSRIQTNSMLNYLNGGPMLAPWEDSCHRGDSQACTVLSKVLEITRTPALVELRKIGSAFCKSMLFVPKVDHFALRIRVKGSVPWSQRNEAEPGVKDSDLGIFAVDDVVTSPRIWTRS